MYLSYIVMLGDLFSFLALWRHRPRWEDALAFEVNDAYFRFVCDMGKPGPDKGAGGPKNYRHSTSGGTELTLHASINPFSA